MVLTESQMNKVANYLIQTHVESCTNSIHEKIYGVPYRESSIKYKDGKLTHEPVPIIIKDLPMGVQKGLCDCITESFNATLPIIPKGKETQTRKSFVKAYNIFDKMKKKGELINCSKNLIPIDKGK